MSKTAAKRSHGAFTLVIISALIAVAPFSLEVYLPALSMIADEMGTSIVKANLTITTYMLGMGFGQFFGGPISDQLGRKKSILAGLSLFVLATVGVYFSTNIDVILVLRFFQALGAGFAGVVGTPLVRDLYGPQEAARKMPMVISVMVIAPMIAPVFGTVLMQWDWRLITIFTLVYAVIVAFVYVSHIGETHRFTTVFSFRQIFVQCGRVLSYKLDDRRVGCLYISASTLAGSCFMVLLTNISWVYFHYFEVSEIAFPLYFSAQLIALVIANLMLTRLLHYFDPRHILKISSVVQLVSIIVLLIWLQFADIGINVFVIFVLLIIASGATTSSCISAMLFGYYYRLTGSVVAINSLSRSLAGGALGGLSVWLFNETLVPILGVMLLGSSCCFILTRILPKATLKELADGPVPEGV